MDMAKRQRLINEAIRIVQDEVLLIPLHRQVIPWASRAGVRSCIARTTRCNPSR